MENNLLQEVIEEVTVDLVFEMHRKLVSGKLCVACPSPATDLMRGPGVDIFGTPASQIHTSVLVPCENCGSRIASTRFAPHLEKCMGRGGRQTRARQPTSSSGVSSVSTFLGAVGSDEEVEDRNDDVYKPISKNYERKRARNLAAGMHDF